MKIALIMEYSQSGKNELIYQVLSAVAAEHGHTVVNYGQFDTADEHLTYNEVGLMTALVLNGGAADFVVTGCGTGIGAMLACNAFPGVECGHAQDPTDAFLFTQVNGGNALALPYAKGFGWGGELNIRYLFEKLFIKEFGLGYPAENAASEQRNAKILNDMKKITHNDMITIVDQIDSDMLQHVLRRESFRAQFLSDCQSADLKAAVEKKIAEAGF
ncbi:MAG: RpiB/LacA/LacB family sugar-phosphate isomerase [Fastidiosipilaceae bacterium]|jgi:ribose 5-phosphate isomerase RpiB